MNKILIASATLLGSLSTIVSGAAAMPMTTPVQTVPTKTAGEQPQPVANPAAVVTVGNARFTVLTPQLIRMEWSADGKFEDNKTLTFVNRNLPVPQFTAKKSGKGVTIKTSALTLSYKGGDGGFTDKNLEVKFKVAGKPAVWRPGMAPKGNLKGTMRTLDGVDGYKFRKNTEMEQGLLSRDGWAVVDDSNNHLFVPDNSHWQEWVSVRPDGERQDLYLFAYGHDYKKGLADYQKVAGRATLPPKYTFGYWWSRYWQYSDNEFKDLVDKLKSINAPIDVLIVDMDWHDTFGLCRKNPQKDEYGQRVGWTGYTWQNELFPNPQNFLKWVKRENLKTALNLHPASGIQPYEECYKRFAKEYGWQDTTKSVPFKMDEVKWADAYFKTVLEPMERDGVDFWWLDWQQWLKSKYTKDLSNTYWLNYTFYNHAAQKEGNERPFIYHRWGGLGSHRYPLGFSGDTFTSWETLRFLPYFTATSSNVNYGYWGHDIGGHMFKADTKSTDPELYLRWLQYGVFTPIFKTHSTKNREIVRYFWAFPDHMFMMRDALNLRYALAPYVYNAARENYDTGVAMTRPMYYEYPERDEAYSHPEQFFFGNDILTAPVANPIDSVTGLAERSIWFPVGKWYDYSTGAMIESDGNGDRTLEYTLSENPFYVKAGSILPMNPASLRSLQDTPESLVLTFIPGGDGSLAHYEDDGKSEDYKERYAVTDITKKSTNNALNIAIAARKGDYAGAPAARRYELRFPATMPPSRVVVDGKEYPYSRFPQVGEWGYDGYSLEPVVYTAELPTNRNVEVTLEFADGNDPTLLYGKKGVFNRCLDLTVRFKEEQGAHGEGMKMLPQGYLKVSQCPNFVTENPAGIRSYLGDFEKNRAQLFELIDNLDIVSAPFKTRIKAQLK